jgi:hypothetical protein
VKRSWTFTATGAVLGALGGWLYWSNIGCSSGGCMITSHPLNSALYGAVVGGLLGSFAHDLFNQLSTKNQQNN